MNLGHYLSQRTDGWLHAELKRSESVRDWLAFHVGIGEQRERQTARELAATLFHTMRAKWPKLVQSAEVQVMTGDRYRPSFQTVYMDASERVWEPGTPLPRRGVLAAVMRRAVRRLRDFTYRLTPDWTLRSTRLYRWRMLGALRLSRLAHRLEAWTNVPAPEPLPTVPMRTVTVQTERFVVGISDRGKLLAYLEVFAGYDPETNLVYIQEVPAVQEQEV